MLRLARLMRCAIVASGTRKAAAISRVVRPPTARSVSAIAEAGLSAGWQQRNRSSSVSSAPTASAPCGSSVAASSSRRLRAPSLRSWSTMRRDATWMSQPRGLSGTPSLGPLARRRDERLLHRVLGGLEVVVAAHERAEDLRRELAQQALDVSPASPGGAPSA